MNPYKVLGVSRRASLTTIKTAYRKRSREHHPDAGGCREEFERVVLAWEILSDKERRRRYDETGRTDDSPVTPEALQSMIRTAVNGIIDKPGASNDPVWEDVQMSVLGSIRRSQIEIQNNMAATQRKLERVERMIERFKPLTDADPVGDALREKRKSLRTETTQHQDAMEMSRELEKVFLTYKYKVGPQPEGQHGRDPTARRSGPRARLTHTSE